MKLTGIDPYERTKEVSICAIELLDIDVADHFDTITYNAFTGSESIYAADRTMISLFDEGCKLKRRCYSMGKQFRA